MAFASRNKIDSAWAAIARATVKGKLGSSAKVSPYRGVGHGKLLICVFVNDFTNVELVHDVRRKLRRLSDDYSSKPPGKMFQVGPGFKPDIYTHLGIYAKNKWGIPPMLDLNMIARVNKEAKIAREMGKRKKQNKQRMRKCRDEKCVEIKEQVQNLLSLESCKQPIKEELGSSRLHDQQPKKQGTSNTKPKVLEPSRTQPKEQAHSKIEPKKQEPSKIQQLKKEGTSKSEHKEQEPSKTQPKNQGPSKTKPKKETSCKTEPKQQAPSKAQVVKRESCNAERNKKEASSNILLKNEELNRNKTETENIASGIIQTKNKNAPEITRICLTNVMIRLDVPFVSVSLMSQPGAVITKSMIISKAWQETFVFFLSNGDLKMKLKNNKSSYPDVSSLSKIETHLCKIVQDHQQKLNSVLDFYNLRQPPYVVLYEKLRKKYKLSERFVVQSSDVVAIREHDGGKKYLCYVGHEELRIKQLDWSEGSGQKKLLDQVMDASGIL